MSLHLWAFIVERKCMWSCRMQQALFDEVERSSQAIVIFGRHNILLVNFWHWNCAGHFSQRFDMLFIKSNQWIKNITKNLTDNENTHAYWNSCLWTSESIELTAGVQVCHTEAYRGNTQHVASNMWNPVTASGPHNCLCTWAGETCCPPSCIFWSLPVVAMTGCLWDILFLLIWPVISSCSSKCTLNFVLWLTHVDTHTHTPTRANTQSVAELLYVWNSCPSWLLYRKKC